MARLRYNGQRGQTGGATLTIGGLTFTFAVAPNFATITGSDYIPLTLEPNTASMEIVYLTAYTSGATTGTITRAAEDATLHPAVAHAVGATWDHGPTALDFNLAAIDSLVAHLAGAETFTGSKTLQDAVNIPLGTATGSQIGTATAQKLALHGATPVIQRAGAAQVAAATTASTNTTPYGFTTAAQADGIVALLNEIRAALVEKGIIKGAA